MGAEDYACLRRRASWTPETALRKLGESREGLWGVGEEDRLERKVLALWARVCGRQGVGARGGWLLALAAPGGVKEPSCPAGPSSSTAPLSLRALAPLEDDTNRENPTRPPTTWDSACSPKSSPGLGSGPLPAHGQGHLTLSGSPGSQDPCSVSCT